MEEGEEVGVESGRAGRRMFIDRLARSHDLDCTRYTTAPARGHVEEGASEKFYTKICSTTTAGTWAV
ncbi:hypothetical protein CBOM_07582 [Ceraceosorus bombacis]|uniref:Uncharacterized protein n=1 Tax=Ceraceosorus bombacis TaxID=401625 RepID=A0A0P1BG22_9BASI|nr:hypothetical protein CBOM_07582 [Ceraceosorus bombacis]